MFHLYKTYRQTNEDKFKRKIQNRNLENLIRFGGLRVTNTFFPYTSGQIGPYFIQSVDMCKSGKAYKQAIKDMSKVIRRCIGLDSFDVISGGESRDWDFSNPVAINLRLPHAKLYKNKTPEGADMNGRRVVHVADLNNEGSSPRDLWIPVIRGNGGTINDIVFYVDRLEGGVEEVEKLGLNRHAIISLDSNAWQFLLDSDAISPSVYKSINERLDDKTSWAHNMLRTNICRLSEILRDENTRYKGIKILVSGYPEIKDELIDMLIREGLISQNRIDTLLYFYGK